jgi:hypothetical protein
MSSFLRFGASSLGNVDDEATELKWLAVAMLAPDSAVNPANVPVSIDDPEIEIE